MLAGTSAFGGRAGLARRFGTPPRVKAKRGEVPDAIDDAVAKAMAREPEERFHTVRDFARALST
jgi:hypothetical protein